MGGSSYGTDLSQAAQMVDLTNPPISGSICRFSFGDMFWSGYYSDWIVVYFIVCVDSIFYICYSLSGEIEGPYSGRQTLYKATPTSPIVARTNYAGHDYPQFLDDGSGAEMLLNWTIQATGGYQMGMAKATFG